jgi:hypothetical protein
MSASITDKFRKYSDGSNFPNAARVSSPRSIAGATLACDDLTGWTTATGVDLVTFQEDTNGDLVDGTETVWKGVVSGNNITTLTRVKGAADAGNAINDVVMQIPTSSKVDDLVDGLLVSLDQDGTLKAGAVDNAAALASNVVTTAKILDANITTAKIADNNVTAAKLATSAITLGYTEKSSNTVVTGSTFTDLSSLSQTVTVPSGGRDVYISFFSSGAKTDGAAGTVLTIAIREGSTVLGQFVWNQPVATYNMPIFFTCRVPAATATAGSHTYKVSAATTAGNFTIGGGTASSTSTPSPAYILVETR